MLKTVAIIFGLAFLVVGALGFVSQAFVGGKLFGLFAVDFVHNLIHLGTGIIALFCGLHSERASRNFFRVFGIIYGLVALAGLYYMDRPLFGMIAHNIHDLWLHALVSIVSLYLGFVYRDRDFIDDHRNRI